MAKAREAITTNGRAAFYAAIWEDLRNAALDCGWALALHGSLASDMDIMAMPWVENATDADIMINKLCECFWPNNLAELVQKDTTSKPNNRVVYTLPIWADFYLDINVIEPDRKPYNPCMDCLKENCPMRDQYKFMRPCPDRYSEFPPHIGQDNAVIEGLSKPDIHLKTFGQSQHCCCDDCLMVSCPDRRNPKSYPCKNRQTS